MVRLNGEMEILQLEENLFAINNEYIIIEPAKGDLDIQIDLLLDKSINAYQSGIMTFGHDYLSYDATKIGEILDYRLSDLAALLN